MCYDDIGEVQLLELLRYFDALLAQRKGHPGCLRIWNFKKGRL